MVRKKRSTGLDVLLVLFAVFYAIFFLVIFWPITPLIIVALFIHIYNEYHVSEADNKKTVISNELPEKKLIFTYGDDQRSKYCEFLVARYLSTLDKKFYTVINNVTLASAGGNTTNTQIDHLVVSRYGIFCIETKSHRGWIYCKENEQSWLQILPKSCNEFYSPFRQNFAHTRAIGTLLGSKLRENIVSIVVFTSADVIIKQDVANVGNIGYMLREIDRHKTYMYSQYEYEKIVNIIQSSSKNDEETAYRHKIEVSNLVASLSA